MKLRVAKRLEKLREPPSRVSSDVLRFIPEKVDRKTGFGRIKNLSIITRGEANGHGFWIDSAFLGELEEKLANKPVKSRFRHPGLSSDGLGTVLGTVHLAGRQEDKLLGDLHFLESAHQTPEGNLAEYVMSFAEESPQLFGTSIVFQRNPGEELKFLVAHGAKLDSDGFLDLEDFQSPDPDNLRNLPHARLKILRAVDVVDDPAANPDGMFASLTAEGQLVDSFDELASYVLGLSAQQPPGEFPIHPDRLRGYFSKFLKNHNLTVQPNQIMSLLKKLLPDPDRQSLSALKKEVISLEQEIDQKEDCLQQAETEVVEFQKQISELGVQIQVLTEKLSAQQDQNTNLEKQVETLKKEAKTVQEMANFISAQQLATSGHPVLEVPASESDLDPPQEEKDLLSKYQSLSGEEKWLFLRKHRAELYQLALAK